MNYRGGLRKAPNTYSFPDVTEFLVHPHREELVMRVAMPAIEAMAAKVHVHFGARR